LGRKEKWRMGPVSRGRAKGLAAGLLLCAILGGVGYLQKDDTQPQNKEGIWKQMWTNLEEQVVRSGVLQTADSSEEGVEDWVAQLLLREFPAATQYKTQLFYLEGNGESSQKSVDFEGEEEPQPELSADQGELKATTISSTSGKIKQGDLTMNNYTTYDVNMGELAAAPVNFQYQQGKKQVLIVHTHTTESYMPTDSTSYDRNMSFRSRNESENMVAVGEVLAQQLESMGIGVIHDKTVHDYPSYNGSYNAARKTIEQQLAQNPDIAMVLDLHRDAMMDGETGLMYKTVTQLEGETYAQMMLVMGTDQGGLTHDNWRENLKMAFKVQDSLNNLVPNIARPVSLKQARYNEHATLNSLLVEMGTCGNTIEEAKRSAKVLGQAVGEILLSTK
jgi:stage II sporulation protein P